MVGSGSIIQGGLPIFDGKMFDDWKIKMKVVFQFQDVADVIETGPRELSSKATEEDKKNYKLQQKLDGKARFLLYQCVNSQIFKKISQAETTKEAWEILIKTYGDGDKHKTVKLQALKRKFEFLMMEESETVAQYLDKIQELVNAMKSCGDKVSEQHVINKVLSSLPPKFNHLVITIKETKNLATLEIEELQHSLEAHEFRMDNRKHCQEQVLQARTNYKTNSKGFKKGGKHRKKQEEKSEDESKARKDQKRQGKDDKEWKKKLKCYNCQKLGHFARECWYGEGAKNRPKNQANLTQDEASSNSDVVMLMAKTSSTDSKENSS